jgi:prolyl-tRNA synthetase
MAMPVIKGEKTPDERFPGAVATYTIEAMMQDRKALQAGTSHFLGQNFSKAQEIKFQNQNEQEEYAWTTSWGVSTRLVGGLIMTHSDDDGLVIPPRLAPRHVVIIPIYRNDQEQSQVLAYCNSLAAELGGQRYHDEPVRVEIDDRDLRGGEKVWQHIKRGVPLRLEIGPRDVASDSVFLGRRDRGPKEKAGIPRTEFVATATSLLEEIQQTLRQRAVDLRESATRTIDTLDEFREFFAEEAPGGFALTHWAGIDQAVADVLGPLKVTPRCIPLTDDAAPGTCPFTGRPSPRRIVFAKAY